MPREALIRVLTDRLNSPGGAGEEPEEELEEAPGEAPGDRLGSGELERAGERWRRGAAMDWTALRKGGAATRISPPLDPFDGEGYGTR